MHLLYFVVAVLVQGCLGSLYADSRIAEDFGILSNANFSLNSELPLAAKSAIIFPIEKGKRSYVEALYVFEDYPISFLKQHRLKIPDIKLSYDVNAGKQVAIQVNYPIPAQVNCYGVCPEGANGYVIYPCYATGGSGFQGCCGCKLGHLNLSMD